MLYRLALLIGGLTAAAASGDHAATGATDPWEWAGTFDMPYTDVPNMLYKWTAQSKAYKYADPTMDIVFLPITDSSATGLAAQHTEATHSFATTCVVVTDMATIVPQADKCFKMTFDENKGTTTFYLSMPSGFTKIAVFAQHFPTEFERDLHYLHTNGNDIAIEPVAQEPAPAPSPPPPTTEKHWGAAIGASFLVCICTLIGVFFLAPNIAKLGKDNPNCLFVGTNAFAAGALLAAAFYLMLFEATHLIVPITDTEAGMVAWWGSAVILGFLTAFIIECITFAIMGAGAEAPETKTVEVDVEGAVTAGPISNKRLRVLSGVLLGDFMHNLVDGIIIGVAFSGCGTTKGWSITASTIYHELAQEVSDYIVLTDPNQGALKPLQALGMNFVSGLSVVLGAIIMLSQDSISNEAQALLLAYGGGIYLQIAAVECMPRMHTIAKSNSLRMLALFCFIVGCVAIGLVLMDHEHCVPPSPDGTVADPHAGHNHGR